MTLQKSFMFGVSVLVTVVSIFGAVNVSYNTFDDTEVLYKYLGQNRPEVLGANNLSQSPSNGCPKEQPISGWIDFRGKKIITDTFPAGQTASACFANIQEAQDNGYEAQ